MEFFISTAWAQAAPSPTGGLLQTALPLLLIFVVFYFLLIRPQTKRAKEHREMIGKLAAGDEIVTNGGLLGRISEVGDSFVTLAGLLRRRDPGAEVPVAQSMPKGTYKAPGARAPLRVQRYPL